MDEALALFGQSIIEEANRIHPEEVNALAVEQAAGALLRLAGRPERQIALVESMDRGTAVALCRWIVDPSFWRQVAGIRPH